MSSPEFSSVNPDKAVRGFSDLPPPSSSPAGKFSPTASESQYNSSISSSYDDDQAEEVPFKKLQTFAASPEERSPPNSGKTRELFLETSEGSSGEGNPPDNTSTSSTNCFSTIGNIIAWPFVKIYELFACLFNSICCCCCKSNVIDRFFTNPESVMTEFRKDPPAIGEEVIDLLFNDPKGAEESVRKLCDSKEMQATFETLIAKAEKKLEDEAGPYVNAKLLEIGLERLFYAGSGFEDVVKFILENIDKEFKKMSPKQIGEFSNLALHKRLELGIEKMSGKLVEEFGDQKVADFQTYLGNSSNLDIDQVLEKTHSLILEATRGLATALPQLKNKELVKTLTPIFKEIAKSAETQEATEIDETEESSEKEKKERMNLAFEQFKEILFSLDFLNSVDADTLLNPITEMVKKSIPDLKNDAKDSPFLCKILDKIENALNQNKAKEVLLSIATMFALFAESKEKERQERERADSPFDAIEV